MNTNCSPPHPAGTELKKYGNIGNKFPEPISVFRKQLIRQGRKIQESVKPLSDISKKKGI